MTTPTTDDGRVPILAYAYELLVGDLVVDTWEGTSREVAGINVTTRDVTVTFTDGTTEKSTQRPGQQTIYDVRRLAALLPPMDAAVADEAPDAEQ